jgi:MFS family permease
VLSDFTTNPDLVVLIYVPSGVVSLLIAPYLGRLVDRIKSPYLGMIATGIGGSLATVALLNAHNEWAFMLTLILVSTASTTESLIIQNFISRMSKTRRGRFFGLRSLFAQIGAIIGPILGGIVWDSWGIQWPFIISIFAVLALIPLYVVAMRKILPHLAEKVDKNS